MLPALGCALAAIAAVLIWFRIPFSPLATRYRRDVDELTDGLCEVASGDVLTEQDVARLPEPLRRYLRACGFIGAPRAAALTMVYRDVSVMQGRNGPALTIDYTQWNSADAPLRLAFIDSGLFGIPFQGYDVYRDGKGAMVGVLGKAVTLFDQQGPDMDRACLATYLAEAPLIPASLLQDAITWEAMGTRQVRATIVFGGQTVSGVFTFNERDEYISFYTEDRAVAEGDGEMAYVPWTAECGAYERKPDGKALPTRFRATWNYPDGDFTYFDGRIAKASYRYRREHDDSGN